MWNGNLFLVDAIHRGRESRAKKKKTENQEKQNIKNQE